MQPNIKCCLVWLKFQLYITNFKYLFQKFLLFNRPWLLSLFFWWGYFTLPLNCLLSQFLFIVQVQEKKIMSLLCRKFFVKITDWKTKCTKFQLLAFEILDACQSLIQRTKIPTKSSLCHSGTFFANNSSYFANKRQWRDFCETQYTSHSVTEWCPFVMWVYWCRFSWFDLFHEKPAWNKKLVQNILLTIIFFQFLEVFRILFISDC